MECDFAASLAPIGQRSITQESHLTAEWQQPEAEIELGMIDMRNTSGHAVA